MKKFPTDHWTITPETQGLLFFAQRLSEMLSDFTIDTFKAPALNTLWLLREALRNIDFIESEIIDKKHLRFITEEINWSYKNDLVIKKILGDDLGLYFPLIYCDEENKSSPNLNSLNKNEINNIQKTKLILQLLINRITVPKYIKALKLLISEKVKDGTKKSEINHLINNFVTTLVNLGYSQSFIFYTTNEFFFNPNKSIDNVVILDEFLSIFDLKPKNYQAIFVTSDIYKEFKDSCAKLHIKIQTRLGKNILATEEGNKLKTLKDTRESFETQRGCFVVVDKIKAFDEYSARRLAGQRLRRITDLFSYFHHKEKPRRHENALIRCLDSTIVSLISPSKSSMKKGFDMTKEKAAQRLRHVIAKFGMEPKSFNLFNRAIDLHGLAVADYAVENQILNVWVALETVIQEDKTKSKIQNIIDCIVPFLTIDYVKMLITDTKSSLIYWNNKVFNKIIRKVSKVVKGDILQKTTALIACEEFENLREELYSNMDTIPLLKYRVNWLHEQIKSGEAILRLVETHRKKVQWHIRRIYRARNLIVHEGTVPDNIEILVENAHTYLDNTLNQLIVLVIEKERIVSIQQGIKQIELLANKKEELLKENKLEKCNKDNFRQLIL